MQISTNTPSTSQPQPPPPGRIDLHSHILPGIDDGCATLEESMQCVRALIAHGFVGTVCTPHCWPMHYPHITPAHITAWRDALQQALDSAGLDYALWTGGELRLYPGVIQWMQSYGVPTLGNSRYVLCDFWEADWYDWIDQTIDWLIERGYTPILAHPERSPTEQDYDKHLDELVGKGVLLQGNLRCFTGEEGHDPDQQVRQYMAAGRYTLLALDMHRPNMLQGRLDGIALAIQEYGADRIEPMLDAEVRRVLFGA